jgi:hypothetical protein
MFLNGSNWPCLDDYTLVQAKFLRQALVILIYFRSFSPSRISNDHHCIAPIRIIPLAEIFGV